MLPTIVSTLAKFVPVVAPVVKDVAGGVLKGLTHRPRQDLPRIADQFSRISGDFLNDIVRPGNVPTVMPGGCIPPPDSKLPIIFPPDPRVLFERLAARIDRLVESLDGLLKLLNDLLVQMGRPPGPAPASGGLYSDVVRTSGLGPAAGEVHPPESTASTGPLPAPALSAPSAPKAWTPSSGPPGASPEGLGGRALERLFDDMNAVESQINGLDPNDPKAQFRLMQLQQKMQRITQMIHLITEMRKALHDTAMAIIRNIR